MEYVRKYGKMGENFRLQLTLEQHRGLVLLAHTTHSTVKNLQIILDTPKLQYIGLKSEPCGSDPEKTSFISYLFLF